MVIFYVVLCSFCVPALAQDVRGYWKGSLSMVSGCFPENNIELQVKTDGDSIIGDSYHYLDVNNYVKKDFSWTYNASLKQLIVQEARVTAFRIRPECRVCIKRYVLYYSRTGKTETLTGSWTGYMMGTRQSCDSGKIVLYRIKESAFKEIPEVAVDTGQLRLDFYDNNQVDGDSISVTVNGKTVLSHQRLSAKPVTLFVPVNLDEGKFQEVEMIAENLGTIPPNTALLIVTAGERRYQLFLSSTEIKSARVRFFYDPVRRGVQTKTNLP